MPWPSPGPRQERPVRRQVSWLAGQHTMHAPSQAGFSQNPAQWRLRALFGGPGAMCIALAAYSCRDSLGFGWGQAPSSPRSRIKPFRAPARSLRGRLGPPPRRAHRAFPVGSQCRGTNGSPFQVFLVASLFAEPKTRAARTDSDFSARRSSLPRPWRRACARRGGRCGRGGGSRPGGVALPRGSRAGCPSSRPCGGARPARPAWDRGP